MKANEIKYYLLFTFVVHLVKRVNSNILVNCFGVLHCKMCHVAIRNCFLSGTSNMSKCIKCEENYYNIRPCTHQIENFIQTSTDKENFVELKDHDYLTENKVDALISEVVKMSSEMHKNEASARENLSEDLKKKIMQLCLYSNFSDNYENANKHEQASVEDVEKHIHKIVTMYIDGSNHMEHIINSMKNPALCLKNPAEWTKDRAGYKDNDIPSVGIIPERKLFKPYQVKSLMSSLYSHNSNCNRQFCDRFSDPNECENKIRVLNQGTCGNCWAFASSQVISAYRCRKSLGFAEPSVKYVTLCKNKQLGDNDYSLFGHYNDNICREGGHLSYYLETVDKSGILPTSYDVPYNEPLKGADCPENNKTWSNMWEKVNLIDRILNGYLYRGYFKISFHEYTRNGKTEELIRLLKDYIIEQGSLFVSMQVNEKLSFDHDGEKVMMNCEYNESPDHALVLIGYGEYMKPSGEKSSYWLIRNSWGSHWGDKGNFKVDMYGPGNCNGAVLCNAFPLLLQMRGNKINKPLPNDMASTDNKTRYDHSYFNRDRNRNNSRRYNYSGNNQVNPNGRRGGDNNNPFDIPNPNDTFDDQNRYEPNFDPYNGNNNYPHVDNKKDMARNNNAGISDNNRNRNIRHKVFRTTLSLNIGNTQFKRNIHMKRKDEYKEKTSCLRTYSMDTHEDISCRNNCERFIDKCQYYTSVGGCLMKYAPNYKCVYCGM
ncbi:serine-repeat antigen 9 [Plasmodium gonderi]|uniref:Putative papain-like cysteine prorease n=1 Tax=Plasmodium gonderi TaxID=77519 RepID=F1SZ36_PLAGO|nr:serine-repeat antigen 9 [Plasmodium gonderi]BAK08494.1 putative papain-like cysteine prorease [Plasmodium gonderi]GAW79541.1 serine-repeat antigen 9 [Plasmodium gonderi]